MASEAPAVTPHPNSRPKFATVIASFTVTLLLIGFAGIAASRRTVADAVPCGATKTLMSTGTVNWTAATWSGGGYPGQTATNDCAVINNGATVQLNSAINSLAGLNVQTTGTALSEVQLLSGGSVTLVGNSTLSGSSPTSRGRLTVSGGSLTVSDALLNVSTYGGMTFDSGSMTLSGTTGGLSVANLGEMRQTGGTLTNNVPIGIAVQGTYKFDGGTIGGSGITAVQTSSSGGAFDFSGATSTMVLSRQLDVQSGGRIVVTSTANPVNIGSGAFISVQSAGTLELQSDASLTGVGSIILDAGATLKKTSGLTSVITAPVQVNGTVDGVVAGTTGQIVFGGAGSSYTGALKSGSTSLAFNGGTHTFNTGLSFAGSASAIAIKGAATTITNNIANLVVPAGIEWYGGSIGGSGSLSVAGSSTLDPIDGNLTLNIPWTHTDSSYISYANSGTNNLVINSTFTVPGTFEIRSDRNIAGTGTLAITSGGTLSKTEMIAFSRPPGTAVASARGRASVDGAARVTPAAIGAGTVISPTLNVTGGTINADAPNPLYLSAGSADASSSITASTLSGSNPNAGVYFVSGTFSVASATPFSGDATIGVDGGTLSIGTAASIPNPFALTTGTLTGANVTLDGGLTWSGGTMSGSATTTIPVAKTLAITGTAPKALTQRTISNSGTITVSGTGIVNLSTSPTITNQTGGLVDLQVDANFSGTGTFNNIGTLTKSGGTGVLPFGLTLNNSGILNVQSGTLQLNGGGTGTAGQYNVSAGATLDFGGGTSTLDAASQVAGAGIVSANGATGAVATLNGTCNITGGTTALAGTLNILGPVTSVGPITIGSAGTSTINLSSASAIGTSGITQSTGTLTGSSNITVNGTYAWSGGTLSGSGSLTIPATRAMNLTGGGGKTLSQRTITNAGTITVSGTGGVSFSSNPTINNQSGGVFDLQTDTLFSGTGTFNNSGTLTKSGGTAVQAFGLTLNNSNILNVQSGTLQLNGGGTGTAGQYNVSAGATLDFGGGTSTLDAASQVAGAGIVASNGATGAIANINGTCNITGGTTALAGTLNILGPVTSVGPITIGSAGTSTINLSSASAIGTSGITQSTGTLTGSSNITVNGMYAWSGGTLSGSGSLTIPATRAMNLTGGGGKTLSQRTITNAGTITVSGTGGISLASNPTIDNQSGGLFDLQADTLVAGTGTFTNSGTLRKSGGTGTQNFGVAVSNGSAVEALSGTLSFTNGFTQSAGSTLLNGGNLASPSMMSFNGGTLGGSGAIAAAVSNSGASVNPGLSPGALTINGDYTQGVGGTLNIELQGTTPATQYDQLIVNGNVNLNGTITVNNIGGFTPGNGNTFDVLTYSGTRTGDFSTYSMPPFGGGGSFSSSYITGTPNVLRVLAAITSADIQVTKTAAAASILRNQNAVFTVTVTNLGTSTATNVTLSDSFSGGTFVSVASSQGTCSGTGPVSCSIGTLASGASATITLTINGNAVSTISNTASATATEFDPASGNNSGAANVTVDPSADLGLAIVDSPDPVNAGGSTAYTVTVSNSGPDAASSAAVNLSLTNGTIGSVSGGSFSCTNTATAVTCSAATFAAGSTTITVNATASAGNPMTLSGSVSSATGDPSSANNSASQSTTVNLGADVGITKTGPAFTAPGAQVTFTITVKNFGPLTASGVTVNDTGHPRLTRLTVSGPCATFPCNVGTLAVNQTATITATYEVSIGGPQTITNTATVTASTTDLNSSNNSASYDTDIGCSGAPPSNVSIAPNQTGVPTSGTITWDGTGATLYKVYLGKVGSNGCGTLLGSTSSTSIAYSGLTGGTQYEVRVETATPGCVSASTACIPFTTVVTCTTPPATLLEPAPNTQVSSPVTFKWTAVTGATGYKVRYAINGVAQPEINAGTSTEATANIGNGSITWSVVALGVPGCGDLESSARGFSTCNLPTAPLAGVVGSPTSGQPYALSWPAVSGAISYEVDEANNSAFAGPTTRTITTTSTSYTYTATTTPVVRFYRVRAINACGPGPYSPEVRVVTVPLPPSDLPNPNVNAPVGSTQVIIQQIFFPGFPDGNYAFTATVDKSWLAVSPASGVLTPAGITLDVVADPANLPNGTVTGTVSLTATLITSSNAIAHATTVVSKPVSVNLVTPVIPGSISTPSESALIIPSVGHLDGINSRWQSDIRVTNTSSSKLRYQLTFTPSGADAAKGVKTTHIDVDSGGTTALDDIVRNWYGIGAAGDSANGVLVIQPVGASGNSEGRGAEPDNGVSLTTVASSRTYNVTSAGTLGQYIPAIPFGQFIGKAAPGGAATVLSLQQIAQSPQYRTNIGVVEAAGKSASAVVTFFGSSGNKLLELPLELAPGEQKQLNQVLAQNRITLADGRAEVKVTGGDGKITAYASVIDNISGDPLLVSGSPVGATATKWVLPGVADINTGTANWRSDVRIFNSGTSAQTATVTFHPQTGGAPSTTTIAVEPNEVKVLDNILFSLFGMSNNGGAVHVSTLNNSALQVTGRTYNQTARGTYGQFIPAVTPDGAIGLGSRPLEILQVEESVRYRTNVGVAETSGKAATVEILVSLPDSRVTPRVQIPLAANQFVQIPVLTSLGLSNVYNARVTVNVVGGEGRITAYGSVIDRTTQDPTYVPAQQ